MTTFYIDPVNGLNSNAGTDINAPKKDFTSFSGAFVGGNRYLVKAGTTMFTNAGTRANIETSGTSANAIVYLGRYGVGDNPILDGGITNFNPIYIKAGSYITIEDFSVTNAPGSGIRIEAKAGAIINNVIIRRCKTYRNGQNNLPGTDGITGQIALDGISIQNVLIEDCDSYDNNGHGIKLRDGVRWGVIRRCRAWGNGITTPSHGLGAASAFTSPGAWTLVSSTIYRAPVTMTGQYKTTVTSATGWDVVACSGLNGYYMLVKSATPATPGLGEFGIDIDNNVLVNVGVNPTSATWFISATSAKNITVEDSLAWNTIDANGIEGDGIYFDNASQDCTAKRCISYNNQGGGFVSNGALRHMFISCLAFGNAKRCAASFLSDGTQFINCTFVAKPTVECIYVTNGGSFTAKNNLLVGGSVGIFANSVAVISSATYNAIFQCITNYTNVTEGIGSISASTPPPYTDYQPHVNSSIYQAGGHIKYDVDLSRAQYTNPPTIGAYEYNRPRNVANTRNVRA
jgi:hypothetical protein